MRIGIFDPYLDDLGGGEKYMATVAECLSKKHEVSVFWDNKKDINGLLQRFSLDLSKVSIAKNIFSKDFGFLKRVLESRRYDAIIVLSDGSIPFLLSKKTFLHIQQPLKNFNPQTLKGKFKLSRVNAIFCNSQYTKSLNEKKFNIKSFVVYPPVSMLPKNIEKENIILTVGRFRIKDIVTKTDDYKKLLVMIEAFQKLVKKGLKNWKLVLAVSVLGKDRDIFEQMKKSAKSFPIEFLINKSNNELWEIYSKTKIYWHASGFGEDLGKNPEYAEHFGISTVEAMGAGCVPVVINAGGQKEIVVEGRNGFLWDSLEELQSKTLKLINNQDLLGKLSKQASEDAKEFSKERFCKEINDLVLQ